MNKVTFVHSGNLLSPAVLICVSFYSSIKIKKLSSSIKGRKLIKNFVLPPFFAFASPQKPYRVQSYPAAVTGGPVAALPSSQGSVRNSKAIFGVVRSFSFQQPENLCDPITRLLFFSSSFCRMSVDVMNYTPHHRLCQYLFSIFL